MGRWMNYVSGRIARGIYTWLGGSGEEAEPIGKLCPCWAVRSPAGSGGGMVYISACAGGITVVSGLVVLIGSRSGYWILIVALV